MPRFFVSTLAIALISGAAGSASAQVIYQENFDGFATCGTTCGATCDVSAYGWTNVTTDDTDWAVDANGTTSSFTGPSGDHTTGSGNYLYTESSSPCSSGNPVAELYSPVVNIANAVNPVARVWYHMYGGNQGDLHFDLVNDPNNTAVRTNDFVPSVTGDIDQWQQILCMPLDPAAGDVQVVFRGVIGNGYESDMAIDDFAIVDLAGPDLRVDAVRTVGAFCSNTVEIEADLVNGGADLNGATIEYSINGGTPVTETITAPVTGCGGSLTHRFSVPATLPIGPATIAVTVVAAGDTDATNDSASTSIFIPSVVTSFPYAEDFEAGPGAWIASGTALWEHGAPAGTELSDANSGTNAWTTGLSSSYPSNAQAFLTGPCFDPAAIQNPRFEAFMEIEAEFSWDGAQVQTSTDGVVWHTIGAVGTGWYNDGTISGLGFTGDQSGFTGRVNSGNGSNGWIPVAHDVENGARTNLFQVRIVFGSDGSVTDEGVSIDDIRIIDNPPRVEVTDVSLPNLDVFAPGTTDVIVQTLLVQSLIDGTDVTSITLTQQGSLLDTDITGVNLWLDDGDGIVELGTDDIMLAPTTIFSTGTASFTLSAPLAIPANGFAPIYVTFDLAGGVAGGETFGSAVMTAADVTISGTQPVTLPNGPAIGPLSSTFAPINMLPFADTFGSAAATNRRTMAAAGVYPTATSTGTTVGSSAATANDAIVIVQEDVNGVVPNTAPGMAVIAFINGPATGALDYYFDLSSYDVNVDDIYVEFYQENIGATDDPEDHVFVSLDGGATWAGSIYDFDFASPGPSAWSRTQIDLSAFLRSAGLALTNNVVVRIQAAGDGDAVFVDDVFAGIPEAIRVERMAGMPIPSGGTDMLGTIPGGIPVMATYTVHNDGQRDLTVSSSTVAVTNAVNVAVAAVGPDITVPAAGSATIAFSLTVPTQGAFFADLAVATNDPRLTGDYTMTISGIGAFEPEIDIALADGTPVASGDTQDLGQVQLGGAATVDMVLANTGGLDLNLTGTPTIDLANQVNLSAATVTTVPTVLAGGATAAFTVTLTPAARGAFSTQLVVASNDTDEGTYTIDITGMAMEADISVSRGGATVASGGTDDVGNIEVGVAQTLTYSIANGGNQDLGLTGTPIVALSGVPAGVDASLTTMPTSTVAPGATSDAVLSVTATAEGAFTFDMTIASTDPDTPSYTVTVSGAGYVPAPEIVVSRAGSEVPSGGTENVGGSAPGMAQTLTYTVENTGTIDLSITGVTVGDTTNVTASVTTEPATTVAPSATTTFVVSYTPTAEGAMSFSITIANSDADEGTYTIDVTGTGDPLAPEISVQQPAGTERASGSTIDVGEVTAGVKRSTTITIANTGAGPLTISADPTVGNLTNATASIDSTPSSPIAAGGTSTFTVSMTPTAAGAFSGTVTIASDDGDEGTYTVTISGTAKAGDTTDPRDDGGCTCVTDDGAEAPVSLLGFAAFGLLLGLRRRRK